MRASRVVKAAARALQVLVLALGSGSLTIQFTGCTAVGYTLGRFVDSRQKTRFRPADPARRFALERGTEVRLELRDGAIVRGIYDGAVAQPTATYADAYEAWRVTQPDATPRLGERITVKRHNGRTRNSAFAGFDPAGIRLDDRNPNRAPLVAWADVRSARTERGPIAVEAWQAAIQQGTLPLSMRLSIRQRGGPVRVVDAYDVARLEIAAPKHGVMVGTILGATADATVLVAVAALASYGSSQDCGSPYYGGFGD